MTQAQTIAGADFKAALIHAGDCMCAAKDELCALDGAAGDGDLGATLATGFAHVRECLLEADTSDIGAMLSQAGLQLARKAPSTIGTLLATAFMAAGKDLAGVSAVDATQVAVSLRVATDALASRGGATPGERTIVDAMDGAATSATRAAEQGADAQQTLTAAAEGARIAAEATAYMEPRHGRAGWLREGAGGTADAGAVAWAIYLGGLAQGLAPDEKPAASE